MSIQFSHLILASQSPQRAELLRQIVDDFEVIPANIDEKSIHVDDHAQRAQSVAEAKAAKIAEKFPDAIIIAADTFVVFQNKRYEKPLHRDEAVQMLQTFSGQTMDVFTGVCIRRGEQKIATTIPARATFRTLSADVIQRYVADRPITDWAGGFSIKDIAGMSLLSEVTGSMTSVLGLPLEWVEERLAQIK